MLNQQSSVYLKITVQLRVGLIVIKPYFYQKLAIRSLKFTNQPSWS